MLYIDTIMRNLSCLSFLFCCYRHTLHVNHVIEQEQKQKITQQLNTEPIIEPIIQPITEPIIEPITEPIIEPITEQKSSVDIDKFLKIGDDDINKVKDISNNIIDEVFTYVLNNKNYELNITDDKCEEKDTNEFIVVDES